jgi:hypothetical protein
MALYDKASLVLIPSGTKEGVVFSQALLFKTRLTNAELEALTQV